MNVWAAITLDTTRSLMLDPASYYQATPIHHGAGHLFPTHAVYDMGTEDYLNFLCAVDYSQDLIQAFNHAPYRCPD